MHMCCLGGLSEDRFTVAVLAKRAQLLSVRTECSTPPVLMLELFSAASRG